MRQRDHNVEKQLETTNRRYEGANRRLLYLFTHLVARSFWTPQSLRLPSNSARSPHSVVPPADYLKEFARAVEFSAAMIKSKVFT